VTACPYHSVPDPRPFSLVVLGPGPGDPTGRTDPKMVALRQVIQLLLHRRTPLLAVCLSHQLLAAELGLELRRRVVPNQGVQQTVDLFGRPEPVGFYNTFAARSAAARFPDPYGSGDVHVGRDRDGEVFALRGKHFASVQFHPESLLTRNGAAILSELLESLIAADRDDAVSMTS
jgi:2-amino-4-deoxychorismate synthase